MRKVQRKNEAKYEKRSLWSAFRVIYIYYGRENNF